MRLSAGGRRRLPSRGPRVIHSNADSLLFDHLREHVALYFFVLAMLIAGVIVGALAIGSLTSSQVDELGEYTLGFFQSLEGAETPVPGNALFVTSLTANMRTLLVIVLLGFTVIGMPLVALVLLIRGFILGFTVSFLMYLQGGMGFLVAFASVFPHNALIIAAMTFASVNALAYSLNLLASRRGVGAKRSDVSVMWYLLRALLASFVIVFGSAVEGYLVPWMMRLLAGYM